MKKIYDVAALGELLVDFTMNGNTEQGNLLFEANPGGAPCNVLSMLQKLGNQTAFIGKVGDDSFGEMLREVVAEMGINISNLVMDGEVPTTLAFVHTAMDGDRSFTFYRNPGADMMLTEADVEKSKDLIRSCRIFHFGTLSMTDERCDKATKKAIELAEEANAVISFDPNLRLPLWNDLGVAKRKIAYGISKSHILKISDDEIIFFTGNSDIDEGVARLQEQYHIPLIFVTMGNRGSRAYYDKCIVDCPPFLNETTIETTGAGDTFMACVLNGILQYGLDGLDKQKLYDMLEFANAAASIITTRKGALRVMPEEEEVRNFIQERQTGN